MSAEDVTKLVSSIRKFDLLVVGLQEVPKSDVLQVSQETMSETHMQEALHSYFLLNASMFL
jgi:hypothetical protein